MMEKRKQAYKKNIGFVQIPKEMVEKKAEISKHDVGKKNKEKKGKSGFYKAREMRRRLGQEEAPRCCTPLLKFPRLPLSRLVVTTLVTDEG